MLSLWLIQIHLGEQVWTVARFGRSNGESCQLPAQHRAAKQCRALAKARGPTQWWQPRWQPVRHAQLPRLRWQHRQRGWKLALLLRFLWWWEWRAVSAQPLRRYSSGNTTYLAILAAMIALRTNRANFVSWAGAQGVVRFLASYPFTVKNQTLFCGPVAVAGNTYAAMPGQGVGCRSNDSTQGWCEKSVADFCGGEEKIPPIPASGDTCGGQTAPVPLRAVTIGGQCNSSEPSLPSRCTNGGGCEKIPGVAGVCHNGQAGDGVRCVSATELAQLVERGTTCKGFSDVCVLY